jgi:hypothetical protein
LERGPFLEAYLLKSGIFVVSLWANGLSKVELFRWQEATTARVVDSCWRAQARSREVEAEERAMAREQLRINCSENDRWMAGRRGDGTQTRRMRNFETGLKVEVGGPALAAFAAKRFGIARF